MTGTTVDERWFRYDSMNRMTLDGGRRGVNGIERGAGTEITYRVDGSRATSVSNVVLTGMMEVWVHNPGEHGDYQYQEVGYDGQRRETYSWRDDGQLASVAIDDTGYADNGQALVSTGAFTRFGGSAAYAYDTLGRQVQQVDRDETGTAVYDRLVTYDAAGRGLIASERTVTVQGRDTITTTTTNGYGTGSAYALGAVVNATTVSSVGSVTDANVIKSVIQGITTTNSYQWRDGAQLVRSVNEKLFGPQHISNYFYTGAGQLETVSIRGERPHMVTFVTDLAGQVIRRDEADGNYSTKDGGDPHEIWYRYGGREIGYVGNNGSASRNYGESIDRRGYPSANGAFNFAGSPHGAAFAETIDRINSYENGGAGRSYTVQGGETLAGIAHQLWGDGSLWYKLAAANGLSGDGALVTGQVLNVPAGVVRSTYNAESYRPYDPADVLGDLSPTIPTPRGRGNKCGVFGKILLVAVAVAVTVVVAPWATGVIVGSATGAAAMAGAIAGGALAGAAGSIASQGVGLATGIQDRFSWSGVAMGALSGAVGGGVGDVLKGSGFVMGAARGALGNAITQGAAMAVGLQKRFDWVGVAVGGAVGGVGEWAGANLPGSRTSFGNRLGSGLAGGIAGAATRSVLTRTSFGDNVLAVLPDVIGSTVGGMVMNRIGRESGLGYAGAESDDSVLSGGSGTGLGGGSSVDGTRDGTMNRPIASATGGSPSGDSDRNDIQGGDIVIIADPTLRDMFGAMTDYQFARYYEKYGDVSGYRGAQWALRLKDPAVMIGFAPASSYDSPLVQLFKTMPPYGLYNDDPIQQYMLGDGSVFTGTSLALDRFNQQRAAQAGMAYIDRVRSSTIGGIALGVSHEMGANPATQDLLYGLGTSADGLLLSGAALRGGSIRPFTGQNSLNIVNGENGVHANSRLSGRTTYLYELQTKDGQFLKYGISVNPDTRYSNSFMKDKEIFRISSGTRADMMALERQMVISNPGPLNKEPWAVKARGGN